MRIIDAGLTNPQSTKDTEPVVAPAPARHTTDPVLAKALFASWNGDPAVVVASPPGAGKTRLVVHLAEELHRRAGLSVAIAAQTTAQARDVASRAAAVGAPVQLVLPRNAARPRGLHSGVTVIDKGERVGFGINVATAARWQWLTDVRADVLIVDEAWQMTFASLGSLGPISDQVVLVGDPGQIAPVVTGETRRWQRQATGPHQPAPSALIAAHPDAVTRLRLPHTWRLGPDTTALIQPAFYPDLPFTSRRPPRNLSVDGHPLPEITTEWIDTPAGVDDRAIAETCANRVRELLTNAVVNDGDTRPLTAEDIAVVAPHVSQIAAIQARLADLPDVLIGTTNQVQGLERDAVVAVHPLTGYRTTPEFAVDPGRLCVALSRHRCHVTVVADRLSRAIVGQALADSPRSGTLHAQRNILDHLDRLDRA